MDEPVYSKAPSDIVAGKQVLHFNGEDISCGYEEVEGLQLFRALSGGMTILSGAPKSYKK